MKIKTNVSIRGSLAEDLTRKILSTDLIDKQLSKHIENLIKCNDPELIRIKHNGQLIIGKRSERGKHKPDW
jgi:hypothetical protein